MPARWCSNLDNSIMWLGLQDMIHLVHAWQLTEQVVLVSNPFWRFAIFSYRLLAIRSHRSPWSWCIPKKYLGLSQALASSFRFPKSISRTSNDHQMHPSNKGTAVPILDPSKTPHARPPGIDPGIAYSSPLALLLHLKPSCSVLSA